MTFTLVSHLRDRLGGIVKERIERQRKEDAEKEKKAIEVTIPSFLSSASLINPDAAGGTVTYKRNTRNRHFIPNLAYQILKRDGGEEIERR